MLGYFPAAHFFANGFILLLLFSLQSSKAFAIKNALKHRGIDLSSGSCLRYIPSSVPPNRITYMTKLVAAIQDAKDIAHQATDERLRFSNAYSHYFRQTDWLQVQNVFHVIAETLHRYDVENSITVKIFCGDNQICREYPGTHGHVDPSYPNSVRLCDFFFDSKGVEKRLDFKDKQFNNDGWCQPNQSLESYMVAGMILVHELTHFRDIWQQARLLPYRYVSFVDDCGGAVC